MFVVIQIAGTVEQSQDLERRRKDLFRQIEHLGDFRRGTISVNYGKCGKSNCVCARKDHPGHGPGCYESRLGLWGLRKKS